MTIDKIEVSEKFYNELLSNSGKIPELPVNHCGLIGRVKVVINKQMKKGYKIVYKY